jgi:hypothetical protein
MDNDAASPTVREETQAEVADTPNTAPEQTEPVNEDSVVAPEAGAEAGTDEPLGATGTEHEPLNDTAVTPEEAPAPPGKSEEDEALEAEIAALEAELGDQDSAIACATEELHSRGSAEERLQAAKAQQEERETAQREAEEVATGLEARANARSGLESVYATLRSTEDRVYGSGFTDMWSSTVERDTLDRLLDEQPEDGSDATEIAGRVAEINRLHDAEEARVTQLREQHASSSTEVAAEARRTIEAANKELDAELRRLAALRARLRTTLNEQRFHLKRGSHIKPKTVARKPKDEYLELEQQKLEHDKVCEQINEEEWKRIQSRRELEELDREHKHLLRTSANEKATLLRNIEAIKGELEQVDWELQTLSNENSDLRDMRRNMIRAQAGVRQQLRQ